MALQAQIAQLETRLETKRGKKQAYKTAFVGKVWLLVVLLQHTSNMIKECMPHARVQRHMRSDVGGSQMV